jgi:hypothetical protein
VAGEAVIETFFENAVKLFVEGEDQGHGGGHGGGVFETMLFHEQQSKYQPRLVTDSAFFMARSEAAARARPGAKPDISEKR